MFETTVYIWKIRIHCLVVVFFFSVNDITTLEDFQHCENLQELYIRNNKIENLCEICYLKKCEKLRILWLADNPCANRENYRDTVLKNLPNLQKLDNVGKCYKIPLHCPDYPQTSFVILKLIFYMLQVVRRGLFV